MQQQWVLEPGSTAAAQARWHMVETVGADAVVRADAELIVSELVTNAWKHGHGPITVSIDDSNEPLRIDVCSESDSDPVLVRPGVDEAGGRGLLLIEELASAWGFTRAGNRVCVWATLRVI